MLRPVGGPAGGNCGGSRGQFRSMVVLECWLASVCLMAASCSLKDGAWDPSVEDGGWEGQREWTS